MNVTPELAKERLCPHAMPRMMVMTQQTISADKKSQADAAHRASFCVADGCMMWRWQYNEHFYQEQKQIDPRLERRGYCGLAGKP